MNSITKAHIQNFQPFRYVNASQYMQFSPLSEPAYLLCDRQLTEHVQLFQHLFNGEVSFAVKANPHGKVLGCLWQAGVSSFDVASIGEIAMIKGRYRKAQCHYNNPIKSDQMVQTAAFEYGVRSFAVDDETGLLQIAALGLDKVEVSIRFTLDHFDAAYDFGSKFGANLDEARALLTRASKLGMECSLTFHPGSQCTDPNMYEKYIDAAASIANQANVQLHRLNIGGGFPLPYCNTQIQSLQEYMAFIHSAVNRHFGNDAPKLLCEPGRALVGANVSLLTQVIRVRENAEVFINDGIYGGLQEQMMVRLDLPYKVWRNGKILTKLASDCQATTVFGPTCDPIDCLPRKLSLPIDIQQGDFIEFGLMGAYGSATATQFNSFKSDRYVQVKDAF